MTMPSKPNQILPAHAQWMGCTLGQELKAQFSTGLTALEARRRIGQ